MSYDYVCRMYPVNPIVGARVRHLETQKLGTIAPESVTQGHYVMVMFDGEKFSSPCHPTALDYSPQEQQP